MSEYYNCFKDVLNALCDNEYEEWEALSDEKRDTWVVKQARVDRLYKLIKEHIEDGYQCCCNNPIALTISQVLEGMEEGDKVYNQMCSDRYLMHVVLANYLYKKFEPVKKLKMDFYL